MFLWSARRHLDLMMISRIISDDFPHRFRNTAYHRRLIELHNFYQPVLAQDISNPLEPRSPRNRPAIIIFTPTRLPRASEWVMFQA